ncbi:MAG: aminotransferase class I/II-fold pyridoxal phosphate-dependent enzyme [Sphaerochaetaceae bacterium]
MNPLAQNLNETLFGTIIDELLSDYGRRMYFPKGIIAQSAEAKEKAKRYNATIGVALEHGSTMGLPSVLDNFSQGLTHDEVLAYAPTAGEMALRKIWLEEMYRKNPSMAGKTVSLPVVTGGLTHSISIAASLFLEKGASMIVPDMYWGNYNLIINEQREAKIVSFPFFAGDHLNIAGLSETIDSIPGGKISLLLNFPNNPTGYTPTCQEADRLTSMLVEKAEAGKKLMVFIDDAYFGLFFEDDVYKESLFARLCDAHSNILAIKGDAATKEELVWGFRVGFITYGSKGLTPAHYEALVKKTMGAIRGNVSSCSKPGQAILLRGLRNATHQAEKDHSFRILKERYQVMKNALESYKDQTVLEALPFNSGYFMSFRCTGDSEALRLHLLNNYGVGTISLQGKYLRLAFSSIDAKDVPDLIAVVYQGARELFSAK